MSDEPKACTWCRKLDVRWAQFPWGHMRACDACMKTHGGWRRESGKPLAFNFPTGD